MATVSHKKKKLILVIDFPLVAIYKLKISISMKEHFSSFFCIVFIYYVFLNDN